MVTTKAPSSLPVMLCKRAVLSTSTFTIIIYACPTNNNKHLQQQHHSPPHQPPQCEWPYGHILNMPFGCMVILLFLYFISGTDFCQLSTTTVTHLSLHTSTALTSTIGMAQMMCSNMLFGPWYIILKNVIFSIFLTFFLVFPGHSHMTHPILSLTSYIHISQAQTTCSNALFGPQYCTSFNFLFCMFLTFFLVFPGHSHMTHPTPSLARYIHISRVQKTPLNALFGPQYCIFLKFFLLYVSDVFF